MDGLSPSSLSTSVREALETQLDEEEVTRALHDCYGDNVPLPDGTTMAFLQANWDMV